jgi:threonine/homoserine/homoserine lactone efflux protein
VYEESVQPETEEPNREEAQQNNEESEDRGSFIHGLAVGLGIGCIATFVIVWITVFFTPQLPSSVTYENLLSIFVYPLIYLLAVGLIALTAGIARQFYPRRHR